MANKEDKKYLFGQFRCEKCGTTVTGPCNCVCPHCGNQMFEDTTDAINFEIFL